VKDDGQSSQRVLFAVLAIGSTVPGARGKAKVRYGSPAVDFTVEREWL
jgi:hypothetical protein